MLPDSRTFSGREPAQPESALMQNLGLPPEVWKAEKPWAGPTSYGRKLVTLHMSATGRGQAFLVAQAAWGADAGPAAQAAYGEIARVLQEQGLTIVHERLFGSLEVKPAVISARDAAFRASNLPTDAPVTYIQGHPPWGEGFAGAIIQAVSCRNPKDEVWTISDQGKAVGRGWRRQDTTFLLLQNIQGLVMGPQEVNTPPLQAKRLIRRAAGILESQGASYRDVARTWFYLADILAWYPDFNRSRTAVYGQFGILPGQDNGRLRLPASTGINGRVPTGAAGALDLFAVVGPEASRPPVRQLSNPGQQDAFQYGSAFSRGALLQQPEVSLLQVSGTAAIDEKGVSLHPGNVRAQIDCTFDKIAALIEPEGASLADIVAACVFVKCPEDARAYQERAAARGLHNLPVVIMVADICREELLFEIDAEVAFESSMRGF
jgi:enamine deaminase RidA (YjgF/YER057c/UK114 family)